MITLRILVGPDAGKVLATESNILVIGRSHDCAVVLNDGAASRRHCSIDHRGDSLILTDLQSANGTFINDLKTRITTYTLKNGDEILLGESRIRVEFPVLAEDEPTVVEEPGRERTLIQAPSSRSEVLSETAPAPTASEQLTAIRQPDVPIVVTVVNGP